MCIAHELNPEKVDQFEGRLVDILNHSSLALMISVGHRTGLFDTLSKLPYATSEELAASAGLNERYVREWLGAMVTGRFVELATQNGDAQRYKLPAEHAALLTSDAGADNIAVLAQYIAIMGSVEDDIVECFKNGGGVPYSKFDRFHEVMADDSNQSVVSCLFSHILPLVEGLEEKLTEGIEVLDAGCGMGRALNLMAKAYPQSRFTGYDLSEEAITKAREIAEQNGCTNITFEVKDLTAYDRDEDNGRFDLVTAFDAIHDQARPDCVLAGINRALASGGTFLMQDIAASSDLRENLDHPIGPLLYTISTMHCMTVSLAQGGMGLGTMWGKETALRMLGEAGFVGTRVESLDHDIQNHYYISTKN